MTIAEAIARYHEACNEIAFLATAEEGRPRLRPMSPVLVEGAVVWMAADSGSPKMAQIAACPHVEVCYMDPQHKHLRLRGTAEICRDAAIKRRLWEGYPLMQKYFPSPADARYGLLKITIAEGLVMESMSMAYERLEK
jgi:uncharacterized pyridoxamine 5'-phosphate oxidase family protein